MATTLLPATLGSPAILVPGLLKQPEPCKFPVVFQFKIFTAQVNSFCGFTNKTPGSDILIWMVRSLQKNSFISLYNP
jgi:hypothetical protein